MRYHSGEVMTVHRYESARAFNRRLKEIAQTLPAEKMAILQRALTLEALSSIVLKTAVGNPDLWKSKAPPGYVGGRARANWQVTIGEYAREPVEGFDAGGGPTVEKGAAALAQMPKFQMVWIANALPYIIPLENGHSTQAPRGMVRTTIEELRGIIAA